MLGLCKYYVYIMYKCVCVCVCVYTYIYIQYHIYIILYVCNVYIYIIWWLLEMGDPQVTMGFNRRLLCGALEELLRLL